MALATRRDAMDEWARNVGRDVPDRAWLLHDSDTWVQNPHYTGLPMPHPDYEHA